MAPFKITPIQYAVLKVVVQPKPVSGADIGQRLMLDSASITGVLDRMEGQGLIERHANPSDRRAQIIVAASDAVSLLPLLDREMERLNAEAFALLGPEAERVFGALAKLGQEKEWKRHV
ncbi:MAG: MarR family transcriptional regulator [Pseudomonadota bacterium]